MSEDIFQVSKVLNKFYEKAGKATAGNGSWPVFTTFEAGYGFINENVPDGELPIILAVPKDQQDIPNSFFTGNIEANYSNGTTIAKCTIPSGSVSSPKKCSVIGVRDQDGDLVAVSVVLPDWVSPTEVYTTFPTITFPMED